MQRFMSKNEIDFKPELLVWSKFRVQHISWWPWVLRDFCGFLGRQWISQSSSPASQPTDQPKKPNLSPHLHSCTHVKRKILFFFWCWSLDSGKSWLFLCGWRISSVFHIAYSFCCLPVSTFVDNEKRGSQTSSSGSVLAVLELVLMERKLKRMDKMKALHYSCISVVYVSPDLCFHRYLKSYFHFCIFRF